MVQTLLATCVARQGIFPLALAILCELCHVAASDNQGDVAAELGVPGVVFTFEYWMKLTGV